MSQMRKIFTISLISIHLLGTTELGQLVRVPELLTHFFQHHRQNPTINFFEFIAMHYSGGDDGTTADDDIDSKLPYHNINNNTITIAYSPMVKTNSSITFNLRKTKEYNSFILSNCSSTFVSLILQPPRQA